MHLTPYKNPKAHPRVHTNIGNVTPVLRDIATLRVARGMGRTEFGDIAGYGRNDIYRWEKRQNQPKLAAVENMANALGMTLALVPLNPAPVLTSGASLSTKE